MNTCTFFGHRDSPTNIENILSYTIEHLIIKNGVCSFYVGDSGNFDRMVLSILKRLKEKYPYIKYAVVLAYLSQNVVDENSIFPDGIETVPKRFAINHRNNFMVNNSDFVITYTVCKTGGAAKFESIARKHNKIVINIADLI